MSYCRFDSFRTNGAIYFNATSIDTKFLAEDSIFTKCYNSKNGGSLFFQEEGQCVQNRIQSLKSETEDKEYGAYCYIDVSSRPKSQNKIIESSISQAGAKNKKGQGSFYCINGMISIKLINTSFADVYGLNSYSISKIFGDSNISYSFFANNTQSYDPSAATVHSGLNDEIKLDIKFCSYFGNSGGYILLYICDLMVTISECNFISNINTERTLSHYCGGETTVSRCYLDEIYKDADGFILVTDNSTEKIQYEFELPFTVIKKRLPTYDDENIGQKFHVNVFEANFFNLFVNLSMSS